jgi:PAS domain S-box-containing protein
MAQTRILVVEDEVLIAEEIRERLLQAGYAVVGLVDRGEAAIEAAGSARPDLVLMDIRLKGPLDGIAAAAEIFERYAVPIVYLTAHSDQATLQRAKTRAAFGYVLKPFQIENLLATIEVAIHRARLEAGLREHNLAFATILGGLSEAVVTTDLRGRVRFVNAAAESLTGWAAAAAIDRPLREVLRLTDEHGAPRHAQAATTVVATRATVRLGPGDWLERAGGERVAVEGSVAPVTDYVDRVVGATFALRDVTATRAAERSLRARTDELRVVVETAVDGVLLLDGEGRVLLFNPACEALFGRSADHAIGRHIDEFIPRPGERGWREELAGPAPRLWPSRARACSARREDGTPFPVEVSVGETNRDGRPAFVVVVHDVSDRRALEAAYVGAVAHEQARVAQDLHDGLGQELTGLALILAAIERSALDRGLPNASDVGRARDLTSHAITTCRGVARGLLPVAEGHGGLVAGLRELVRQLGEFKGPEIRCSIIEAAAVGLSPETADHLYRIAQEALNNAIKHARAQSITVTLEIDRRHVSLSICDDGRGLVAVPTSDGHDGLGLKTMRYRAELIGAHLSVGSPATRGTCVVCDCPQPA